MKIFIVALLLAIGYAQTEFTWDTVMCTNGPGTHCSLTNDASIRSTWPECATCSAWSQCGGCVTNCQGTNAWGRCWRTNLDEAKAICEKYDACIGITKDNGGYEPRTGLVENANPSGHELYIKIANPVDCVVSDWTQSGECSETCGTGSVEQTRTIITHPEHGGQECPHLTEITTCNPEPCPPVITWEERICTGGSATHCNIGNDNFVRSTWPECDTCTALSGCSGCVINCNNNNNAWGRCWRTDLNQAKEICEKYSECTGITRDNGGFEPRTGAINAATQHPAAHRLYIKGTGESALNIAEDQTSNNSKSNSTWIHLGIAITALILLAIAGFAYWRSKPTAQDIPTATLDIGARRTSQKIPESRKSVQSIAV